MHIMMISCLPKHRTTAPSGTHIKAAFSRHLAEMNIDIRRVSSLSTAYNFQKYIIAQ